MGILSLPIVGFLVILVSVLFLFGELLVRVKGFFGLIGILMLTFYFSFHLTSLSSMLWMGLVFAVGLGLVILDGKLLNDGTFGLIGLLMMVTAVAIPSPSFIYGLLVSSGFLIGTAASFLFLRVFKARSMWTKMTLKDRLSSEMGYNSMNEEYKGLIGETATTITAFRPSGTIQLNDKKYSAISAGNWINKDVEVIITSVDGTRIVIEEHKEQSKRHPI
ncbi:NfeD family protein [Pseudalkalibacillus hwajinpoensis]|uniref:Nodulation protein NfeD n=1 Tax=Guptibacillus hwajinpoensis TaxID=208199 RepID=A0A4U1MHE2_9BACL|nr:NfeD family protein [Pseudalkalibacillus hwajinpoensis]TKD70141.1 nodulation protein NfeD [Pseudalkalibacillus hwajinpoensis]